MKRSRRRPTVIFDRDGTLLDFYEMFYQFILDLHSIQGVNPPSRSEIVSYEYWLSVANGTQSIGDIVVRDRVADVYTRYMSHGRFFTGVAETLGKLSSAGVRVGLVSSGAGTAETRELLVRDGLIDFFGVVRTRDDLPNSARGVEDDECKVLLARGALADLGHDSDDPLFVVGDSVTDVEMGRILGAQVIGVLTGNGKYLPKLGMGRPDEIVDSVAQVTTLVLSARSRIV